MRVTYNDFLGLRKGIKRRRLCNNSMEGLVGDIERVCAMRK